MARHLLTIREHDAWVFYREAGADGRAYSIKKVRDSLEDRDRDLTARFLAQEHEFLGQFGHCPQILKPIDKNVAAGWFRYEDVQGSMRQWVSRKNGRTPAPATDQEVAIVLLDALAALHALHARKIGHGSLGLRTLLVDPNGRVKVGDFVGYGPGAYPPPPFQVGLRYQAPELLGGPGAGTDEAALARADLYCLAYVALELYSGAEFDQVFGFRRDGGGHEPAWLQWHLDLAHNLDLKNKLRIAQGLREVIEQLVKKDPAQRVWPSAVALREHLNRKGIHADSNLEPIDQGEPPPPPPPPPEARIPFGQPYLELTWTSRGRAARTPGVTAGPVYRSREQAVVGNHEDCDLILSSSTEISRKHALFARFGSKWYVFDLNSREGVLVNGEKVAAKRERVRSGMQIGIGPERLTVRLLLGDEKRPFDGDYDFYDLPHYPLIRPLHRSEAKGDVVYLGVSTRTGEPVAIRVFSPAMDAKSLKKFVLGLRAAKKSPHPNILRINFAGAIGWRGSKNMTWYLVTEYMAGGSLREKIRGGAKLGPQAVTRFAEQIGAALVAAADAKVRHRNVNPGCILFDDEGVAKLGDFSLMREDILEGYQQATTGNYVYVDQEYRSPEAVRGDKLDESADVYSLAVCMYEALTGTCPFRRANVTDTMTAIAELVPEPLQHVTAGVPGPLAAAVRRALSKNPGDRFPSTREFVAALKLGT